MSKAASDLLESAKRVMFAMDARCLDLNLSLLAIPTTLRIFDSVVKPVMDYACEVWSL